MTADLIVQAAAPYCCVVEQTSMKLNESQQSVLVARQLVDVFAGLYAAVLGVMLL